MATKVKVVAVPAPSERKMKKAIVRWTRMGYSLDRAEPAKGLTAWTYLRFRKS
jgi:hypothetical protein